MTKEDFMRTAIQLSLENMEKNVGGPFAAVIVKDGKIIGKGWNQVTSSNDPTAHGEIVAIRDACKNLGTFDLHDAEIYTSCEPCPMCYEAISRARIKKIYYANTEKDAAEIGFDDGVFYEDIKKEFTQRDIAVEQVLHDEALEVFKKRANKKDKIKY